MSLCVPSRPPSSIHPHVFVTLSLTELPNHPYVETHTRVCTLFVCDRLKVGLPDFYIFTIIRPDVTRNGDETWT
jgi:hypothetical protein